MKQSLTFQPGSTGFLYSGNIVTTVLPDTPADFAGVRIGWQIHAVNGCVQRNDTLCVRDAINQTNKQGLATEIIFYCQDPDTKLDILVENQVSLLNDQQINEMSEPLQFDAKYSEGNDEYTKKHFWECSSCHYQNSLESNYCEACYKSKVYADAEEYVVSPGSIHTQTSNYDRKSDSDLLEDTDETDEDLLYPFALDKKTENDMRSFLELSKKSGEYDGEDANLISDFKENFSIPNMAQAIAIIEQIQYDIQKQLDHIPGNIDDKELLLSDGELSDDLSDDDFYPFVQFNPKFATSFMDDTYMERPTFKICGKALWAYRSPLVERQICFPIIGTLCCSFWTVLCCMLNVIPTI